MYSIPKREYHFRKPSDGYYAFGDARVTHEGVATVCRKLFYVSIKIDIDLTLEDVYSFSAYRRLGTTNVFMPTAVGFRLQDSGFIRPVSTTGQWRWITEYKFF